MRAPPRVKNGTRPNNWIRFKDAAGHERKGLVISMRYDSLLVGVNSGYVWANGKRIPDNALWVIPIESVIESSVAA